MSKDAFPEHSFIATCLRVGLTIDDLKVLTYVDALKIVSSFLPDKVEENTSENTREANQQDIDRLLM